MSSRIHVWLGGEVTGRIVDLCAGYGLLAQVLLLQRSDPSVTALAVDVRPAKNHTLVHDALTAAFPLLADRITFERARLEDIALDAGDIIVSSHACGDLSDAVLARATEAGARVALLPCCHRTRRRPDLATLADPAERMDEERVAWLVERGYEVLIDAIPPTVSGRNRLLLGRPRGIE